LGVTENPMDTPTDTLSDMEDGVSIKREPCSNKILGKISESISVPKSPGFSPLAPLVDTGPAPRVTTHHGGPYSDAVDLASIMMAWPSIPPAIKAAVKAVLAPYMMTR
jgi:hypothetical protein